MNIGDYEFKVGDEVITIEGERGEIVYICDCEQCKARGFHEPVWRNDYDDDEDYISGIEAKRGFPRYYKIGDYYFNKFLRDWVEECILSTEDHFNMKLRLKGHVFLNDVYEALGLSRIEELEALEGNKEG